MATTSHFTFSFILPRLSPPRHDHPHHLNKLLSIQAQSRLSLRTTATRALGSDSLGDFGARDPFPAELESGFADKVLGNVDTEHKILIPNASALSLAQQDCSPVSPLQKPMSVDDAQKLLKKVILPYIAPSSILR